MTYQHFSEMPVWKTAHELALLIYRLAARFPKDEQYALTSQMQRAAVSVGSNIAEAFGRQHDRDKSHFYYNARGSLYELESQSLLARDLGYLTDNDLADIKSLINNASLDLNRIIKTLLNRVSPK